MSSSAKSSARSTTFSIQLTKPEIRQSIRNMIKNTYLQFTLLFLVDPIFDLLNLYTYTFNFKITIVTELYMLKFFYALFIIPINKAFSDINIIYISKFMDQRKVLVAQTHLLYAVTVKFIVILLVTFLISVIDLKFLSQFMNYHKILYIFIKLPQSLILEEAFTLLIIKNDKFNYFVVKIITNFFSSFLLLFYSLTIHSLNERTNLCVFISLESLPNMIASFSYFYILIKREKIFKLQFQLFKPFRAKLLILILHKHLAKCMTYLDVHILFFLSYFYPKKYNSIDQKVLQFQLIITHYVFLLLEPFFQSANLIVLRYLQISTLKNKTSQIEELLGTGMLQIIFILVAFTSLIFLVSDLIMDLFMRTFYGENEMNSLSFIRILILSLAGNQVFKLFHFVQSGTGNIKLVFAFYGLDFLSFVAILVILCTANKYVEFSDALCQFCLIKFISGIFGLYLTYRKNIENETERELQIKLLQLQNIKDIENMKNKIQLRNRDQNGSDVVMQEQVVISPHQSNTVPVNDKWQIILDE